MKRFTVALSILTVLILVSVPTSVLAQGPGGGPAFGQGNGQGNGQGFGTGQGFRDGSGIVQKFNRVLSNAGAPELSAEQEDALTALIEAHRENRPERQRDQANFELHNDYLDAILAGDLETAQALAAQIAEAMTQRTAERLQDQAEFQIALLGILDPTSQLAVLIEQEGSRGILRLLGPNGRRGRGANSGGGKGSRPRGQK